MDGRGRTAAQHVKSIAFDARGMAWVGTFAPCRVDPTLLVWRDAAECGDGFRGDGVVNRGRRDVTSDLVAVLVEVVEPSGQSRTIQVAEEETCRR